MFLNPAALRVRVSPCGLPPSPPLFSIFLRGDQQINTSSRNKSSACIIVRFAFEGITGLTVLASPSSRNRSLFCPVPFWDFFTPELCAFSLPIVSLRPFSQDFDFDSRWLKSFGGLFFPVLSGFFFFFFFVSLRRCGRAESAVRQ